MVQEATQVNVQQLQNSIKDAQKRLNEATKAHDEQMAKLEGDDFASIRETLDEAVQPKLKAIADEIAGYKSQMAGHVAKNHPTARPFIEAMAAWRDAIVKEFPELAPDYFFSAFSYPETDTETGEWTGRMGDVQINFSRRTSTVGRRPRSSSGNGADASVVAALVEQLPRGVKVHVNDGPSHVGQTFDSANDAYMTIREATDGEKPTPANKESTVRWLVSNGYQIGPAS